MNKAPKAKIKNPSGKKILFIEDERILTEMYSETFVRKGFEVIVAVEPEEAIKLARKEKPDLIILDIILPGKSGIVFLEQMREHPDISSIPVVVFSNYDEPGTRDKAMRLGAEDYLIKADYTPQEAVEKMKEYLR